MGDCLSEGRFISAFDGDVLDGVAHRELVNHLKPLNRLPKHGELVIEFGLLSQRKVELTAAGVRRGLVRQAEASPQMMVVRIGLPLIGDRVARIARTRMNAANDTARRRFHLRGAKRARGGAPAGHQRAWLAGVKLQVVIEPTRSKFDEVSHGHGRIGAHETHADGPARRFDIRHFFAIRHIARCVLRQGNLWHGVPPWVAHFAGSIIASTCLCASDAASYFRATRSKGLVKEGMKGYYQPGKTILKGGNRMTHVTAVYFSPTHSTKRLTETVAHALAETLDAQDDSCDLTLPKARPSHVTCAPGDVLVFGFPVYAGRVPALLVDEITRWQGDGAPAVIVGAYGNRDFDDALVEAADLLTARGFHVVAAGALIAEHSSTPRVATGRPDADDLAVAAQFGRDAAARIASGATDTPAIRGNHPYKDHPATGDIRPSTTEDCTACGVCVARCPLGIIDADNPTIVAPGCLRCNACVKSCPEHAKYFDDEFSKKIVAMLEGHCMDRKDPEFFL